MDYLELICSVGGMAVALYVLAYLLVRTWTKNSLKTRLLGELYKIAPNKLTPSELDDFEGNHKSNVVKKPLVFGFLSDVIFNMCGLRSKYRRFAINILESELDIVNIVKENRNLRNAIRVLLSDN
jgi:hypothetical protein